MTRIARTRRSRPDTKRRSATAAAPAPEAADVLGPVLDRATLRRLAGPQAFARGEDYLRSGQVLTLSAAEGALVATVRGTREYPVRIEARGAELAYACTCPVGTDGVFCKHAVAAGLAWLERQTPRAESTAPAGPPPAPTEDDLRAYLTAQEKAALVKLIMDRAAEDEGLQRRLVLRAAQARSGPPDLGALRDAVAAALDPGGFDSYEEPYDYARRAGEAIDSIERLLRGGRAAEAIDLAEHAIATLAQAIDDVGDSDGLYYGFLEHLATIHHAACLAARPDPEALATRLFRAELHDEHEVFLDAAETYAEVLGERGLAAYRRLAEAEWAKVPVLRLGRRETGDFGRRFRITRIMETLARLSDDVEALVAVRSRDLSRPGAYLEIAEAYRAAGNRDAALEWAERGLRAFPATPDAGLREFLVGEYHRRERHDDALALAWAGFEAAPGLETYRRLRVSARRADRWPEYRERALVRLREAIEAAGRKRRQARWAWEVSPELADRSRLVEIFLWERDVEAAWREAADGGCADHLWLALAAAREREHPDDALAVYQRQLEPTLAGANAEAYREGVRLLRKVRELMVRLGREADFTTYLAAVRARHRRRRNFLRLLDNATWS